MIQHKHMRQENENGNDMYESLNLIGVAGVKPVDNQTIGVDGD